MKCFQFDLEWNFFRGMKLASYLYIVFPGLLRHAFWWSIRGEGSKWVLSTRQENADLRWLNLLTSLEIKHADSSSKDIESSLKKKKKDRARPGSAQSMMDCKMLMFTRIKNTYFKISSLGQRFNGYEPTALVQTVSVKPIYSKNPRIRT